MNAHVMPFVKRGFAAGPILLVLASIFVALFLGLAAAFLPWIFVLGFVVAATAVVLAAASPHLALIFVMMLVFEVIPNSLQPRLPIGPGKLQVYDILILLLSAFVVLRAWANGQRPLQALGPVRWPLYYLSTCVLISLIYVRYFAPNLMALAEARQQIMWLAVPLMVLSADTPKKFKTMVTMIVVIGLIIALYVTLQSTLDIRIMTSARVERLDKVNSDVTRSIAGGGIYIVVFSLFLIMNRMIGRQVSWIWGGLGCLLLVLGLAVQFGRGVWVATAFGLLVSAALYRGFAGVLRIALAGVMAVTLALGVAAVVKPRLAEAVAARALGIGTEVQSGVSFNWRILENQAALPRIERQPFTGVGIGGEYKQMRTSLGFDQETTYIHNGYLYFPLKMGIFAAFIPFAFITAFILTIRQASANAARPQDKGFSAALCGAFSVPVITSFTQPEWAATQGVAAFAIMTGLALLYRMHGSAFVLAEAKKNRIGNRFGIGKPVFPR